MNIKVAAVLLALLAVGGGAEAECRCKPTAAKVCYTSHCQQQDMPPKQAILPGNAVKKVNNTAAPKALTVPVQTPKRTTAAPQSATISLASIHRGNSVDQLYEHIGKTTKLPSPASKLVLPSAIIQNKKLEAALAARKQRHPVQAERAPPAVAPIPLAQRKPSALNARPGKPTAAVPRKLPAATQASKQSEAASTRVSSSIASKQPARVSASRQSAAAVKQPVRAPVVVPKKPVIGRAVKQPAKPVAQHANNARSHAKQPAVAAKNPRHQHLKPANAQTGQHRTALHHKKPNNPPPSSKQPNANANVAGKANKQPYGGKYTVLRNYLQPSQELFKQSGIDYSTAKSTASPKFVAQSVFSGLALKIIRCLNSLFQHLFGSGRAQLDNTAIVF